MPTRCKKTRRINPAGLLSFLTIVDKSAIVRRPRVAAGPASITALATRFLTLRGVLLPLRHVRVELPLLLGREDRPHRRELPLARLLHLGP